MSDAAWVAAAIAMPLGIVAIVAILRGYHVWLKIWRDGKDGD